MRKIFSLTAIVIALTCRCGSDPPRGPAPKWQVNAEEVPGKMITCQVQLDVPEENRIAQRVCGKPARWLTDSNLAACDDCSDDLAREGVSSCLLPADWQPEAQGA